MMYSIIRAFLWYTKALLCDLSLAISEIYSPFVNMSQGGLAYAVFWDGGQGVMVLSQGEEGRVFPQGQTS